MLTLLIILCLFGAPPAIGIPIDFTARVSSVECEAVAEKGVWLYNDGYCYMFADMRHTVSWRQAEDSCQTAEYGGTHLASIHSVDENKFILRHIKQAWIGLNDLGSERGTSRQGWQWTDGTPYGDYENWDTWSVNGHNHTEPDGSPQHNCGYFGFGGSWFDDPCYNTQITRRYVCKIQAGANFVGVAAKSGAAEVPPGINEVKAPENKAKGSPASDLVGVPEKITGGQKPDITVDQTPESNVAVTEANTNTTGTNGGVPGGSTTTV